LQEIINDTDDIDVKIHCCLSIAVLHTIMKYRNDHITAV